MKSVFKFGWVLLFSFAIAMPGSAQTAQNLVTGTGPVTNSIAVWNDTSAINLIAGNSLFPVSSKQTVLYIGITQGGSVDIGNMVIYQTRRNNSEIVDVIPVTYGGFSSISILMNASTCRILPVTTLNPCIVRLDPLTFKLSTLYDYYFVMYFLNTTNNIAVDSATSLNSNTTIIGGIASGDQTGLVVGDVIPSTFLNKGTANFLVGVMTN